MKKITKKARLEKAREVIDRNAMNVPFGPEDWDEFQDAVQMPGATGAIRRVNPSYPNSDPRHVRFFIDGEEVAASWRKSIEGRKPKNDMMRALRLAIQPCMYEFKDAVKEQGCTHCGGEDNLQVDHVWPPFDEIAQRFLDSRNGDIKLVNEKNGIGWVMGDLDVEAEWVAFHASRAEYQILCRSCNASKGNTKAVRKGAKGA